eukprot:201614_1
MNPLFNTLSLALIIIIFGSTNALYTIDSSTITGSNITCVQNDDCIVNCINCNSYTVTCPSGYSCAIACQSCDSTLFIAEQVTNFEFNCTDTCSQAVIKSSLSTINSQFSLHCLASNACNSLDATVSHVSSVYTSATPATNNVVHINCQNTSSCEGVYFDSTVKGAFVARCNGFQACGWGNMVYNPPQNTGQMNIDCYGGRQSCYLLNIVSLSTRQINVNCGNINSNSSSGQGECYHTTVFGPVLPFAVDETDFRFNTMYNDSVVLQCHQTYDCDSFAINVPFGPQ